MATGEPVDASFDEAQFIDRARALIKPDAQQRSFTPLDMQRRLARRLAEHTRVIAIQPTGAGKTLAAALPFAANLLGPWQPGQMVFMTPMRSLTAAQANTLTNRFLSDQVAWRLGLSGQATQPWVRQQTGTAPNDPDFEAVATVATFDQASAPHCVSPTAPQRTAR
jgi:superfamily II DNA or RNA helicase